MAVDAVQQCGQHGPRTASVPKPKIQRAAYFWPGLPQLWIRGSWAGLVVAVGFTALANTLLLAISVFHDWMAINSILLGVGLLATICLGAWWRSRHWRHATGFSTTGLNPQGQKGDPAATAAAGESAGEGVVYKEEEQREGMFREAQRKYLQNDWVRTEQLLLKLLKQDSRDVESRLMLATLWQHQGRQAEALRQLDRLERLEAASRWQYEIDALRQKLAATDTTDTTDTTGTTEKTTEETPRRLAA